MIYTSENFPTEMDSLNPAVLEKAIEISNFLVDEEGWNPEQAVPESIARAEVWFYNLEG
ncbi:hypothetical protein [Rubrolithibacter danxiaensis]|uniref:hypothetical protein n=1 Tax=Rubrolithibacter danxiaensis TaxID=3390805 RepID=UPI003BF80B0B